MNHPIHVGLIGFGLAGRTFHAPFIQHVPALKLHKIRANRPESVSAAQTLYPKAGVVASEEDIFADDKIDLVVIATANSTHFPLAKAALKAGKHVLVDKPFTITSAEAEELIALAQQQNKLLSVYQNRRWDADFRTIQTLVQQQALGELVSYEAHFDRYRPLLKPDTWKEEDLPGAGILYDLGSHLIDQALCLFGKPDAVYGQVQVQRQGSQVPDFFTATLYYPQLAATLTAGMLVRENGPRYVLHGQKGSFVKYGLDVQEEALRAGELPSAANWGQEPEQQWGTLHTEWQELVYRGKIQSIPGDYGGLYQNLAQAINGKSALYVTAQQARDTIRVIELVMQSSEEGKKLAFS